MPSCLRNTSGLCRRKCLSACSKRSQMPGRSDIMRRWKNPRENQRQAKKKGWGQIRGPWQQKTEIFCRQGKGSAESFEKIRREKGLQRMAVPVCPVCVHHRLHTDIDCSWRRFDRRIFPITKSHGFCHGFFKTIRSQKFIDRRESALLFAVRRQ